MDMKCPACLEGKSRHIPGHTIIPGECRVPEMRDLSRTGEEPTREIDRVPRVVESKDKVGKIDPRAPTADDPDAEPAAEPTTTSSSSSASNPVAQALRRPAPRKTADEQTRERVLQKRDRHKTERIPGPTETGEETLTQEWTAFDLGHALKLLHSRDPAVIRRTLRRLHVRFWHAPSIRLSELLRHAGAPDEAIKAIGSIVDSCRVCRMWTRPGPRSMTVMRLANGLNE